MKPYSLHSHAGTCWHFRNHRAYFITVEPYGAFALHGQMSFHDIVNANFIGLVQYHKNCVRIDAVKDRFMNTDHGLMREIKEMYPSLHMIVGSYWITEPHEMIQFRLMYG